jgi:Flp pilus assembly pilin Flp
VPKPKKHTTTQGGEWKVIQEMYARVAIVLRSLRDREEGQGMVEYAVLIGIITAAVIAVIGFLGGDVFEAINTVEDALLGNDGDA